MREVRDALRSYLHLRLKSSHRKWNQTLKITGVGARGRSCKLALILLSFYSWTGLSNGWSTSPICWAIPAFETENLWLSFVCWLLYCCDVYPKNQVSQPLEGLLLRPGWSNKSPFLHYNVILTMLYCSDIIIKKINLLQGAGLSIVKYVL